MRKVNAKPRADQIKKAAKGQNRWKKRITPRKRKPVSRHSALNWGSSIDAWEAL